MDKKLIIVAPPAHYEASMDESHTEIFTLPLEGNPLEHIVSKIESNRFSEVHIHVIGEAGIMVFHGFALHMEDIESQKEVLERFKSHHLKIVIHCPTLADNEEGKALVEKFSFYTGSEVTIL